MNQRQYPPQLAAALLACAACLSAHGAAFVRNPSFESNFNDAFPHYSAVDEWPGATGVNDINFGNGGPFHNPGTPMPDRSRVGFKQGGGDVTQDISGLTPDGLYWLQIFYDARAGGGAAEELIVKFNDTEIGRVPNLRPSTGPYYFLNSPFIAPADTGTIRLTHIVSGDRTVVLDGINVVARSTNDVVLRNPSFEASGILPAVGAITNLAGWDQTGIVGVDDGTGGKANNGAIPDQDLVAFLEGASSLSQPLAGLIVGNGYEVRVAVNASTGTAPRLEIRVGDTVVTNLDVTPGSYQVVTNRFNATVAAAPLVIAQTKDGADTLLVDDVRLFGAVKPPLAPMEFVPLVSEVGPGQTVAHTVSIPAAALESGPVAIRLASSNPGVARLAGAADDGTLILTFTPGGPTTTNFNVETLRRGGIAVNVVDAALIPFSATPAVNVVSSFVKNASFETSVAAAFPGAGPIVAWQGTGTTGLNRTDAPANPAGPFGDNGLVPDREQVGFMQGAGSLSQTITGLTPGRSYWLQFRYNARNCCGDRSQKLTVKFAGTTLTEFAELKPVADAGEVNYYTGHLAFTAAAAEGLLEFVHEVATGDASAVIDAVSIVARAPDEIRIQNPSFEASGSPPGVGYLQPYQIAGWEGGAAGRGVNVNGEGPFSDNGFVPDQDRTAFLQNAGSFLSQTVTGLVAGQRYTLVLGVNARNCCGGQPIAKVSVAEVPLLEEQIPPVGGATPYSAKYLPFTADAGEAAVRLELSGAEPAGSDVSLLYDDVHIVPGERTPPAITTQPASQDVSGDATVVFETAATGANLRYQWLRDGQPLADGARISGVTSTNLTITGVIAADAGNYIAHVTDGLGVVGTEVAVLTVQTGPDGPAIQAARLANGSVRLNWPTAAAGFGLRAADTVNGPYSPVNDPVIVEGDQNVVIVPAGGAARFFQLQQ